MAGELRHGSLFSGIGGFDLAAEWMGWENIFHCELNPFGRKVLNYYWPKAKSYEDITTTDFTIYRGVIDILTGGFPCQPYSNAGKRLGKEDERHLWPQMLRAIREIQPRFIVGENVLGLVSWNGGVVFEEVQTDLEAEGYSVQAFVLPACAIGAPHRRDRVWFVAYRGLPGQEGNPAILVQGGGKPWPEFTSGGLQQGDMGQVHATDTQIEGARELRNKSGEKGTCSSDELPGERDRLHGNARIATDASVEQLQGGIEHGSVGKEGQAKNQGRQLSRSICTTWDEFPTQPPICDGNDGISAISHRETISKEHSMDRADLIMQCLNEGRIEVNPDTGKIYSRMIRGYEGQLIELKGSDCNGYVVHSIKYHGIKKQVKAHQIVWLSVNGVYDKNDLQIDHINRDKKDNRIQNLRLVTAKENNANQNRWKGNFTEDQKDLMFMMHHEGHMSFSEIAEDFGCSKSRIQQIVSEHKFNQLDGITFSKWRTESLKAGGNAVVPQLVYEIFKAISTFDKINRS